MNNKGLTTEAFALMVIVVAAAVVLLFATVSFSGIFTKRSDVEACRLSALAQSKTLTLGKSVVSLDCPRRDVKFYNDKVEISNKKDKQYSFNKLEENIVNKVVADELVSCWYKMSQGNIDVFEQSFLYDLNNICLICSELEFDKNIDTKSFGNLVSYLKREKMPNSETTYFDYLTKNTDANANKISQETLLISNNYVIYFLGFKPGVIPQAIKAAKPEYYVGFGKPDKLKEECNLLVN